MTEANWVTCAMLLGAALGPLACGSNALPPDNGAGNPGISLRDAGDGTLPESRDSAAEDASDDGNSPEAPGPGDDAGASSDGTLTSDASDATPGMVDGNVVDAPDDAHEAGPPLDPECSPTNTWPVVARVASIAPAGFDRFGAISANGLSVAFTNATGTVYIADRASASDSFGPPISLDPGTTALANGRVGLGPTGLSLVATLADGSSFATFLRPIQGGAWTLSTGKEYADLVGMRLESGGVFSEPVLGADGESLFYLMAKPGAQPTLYESRWVASLKRWGTGNPLPNPEFTIANAMQVRRATGASSDARTLFFFDEVGGIERAAWRQSTQSPFVTFVDLPNEPEAAPIADCSVLYFHGMDAMGQGLFTAGAQ